MPVGAAIGAIGGIGSALIGSSAAQSASSQQVAAQQAALAQQQRFFNTAQSGLQPYINNGQQYGSVLSSLLTPGPNQTAALSQIPGYQFAQDWGQKAVQNMGTTTGLGGNTLTAGANYATGLAQQNFGNLINPLVSLYGTGSGSRWRSGGRGRNIQWAGINRIRQHRSGPSRRHSRLGQCAIGRHKLDQQCRAIEPDLAAAAYIRQRWQYGSATGAIRPSGLCRTLLTSSDGAINPYQ